MKSIAISPVDAIFTGGQYPIEFILYYKQPLKTKSLRRTLKQLSSAFWPLFGRYQQGLIEAVKYEESRFYDEQESSGSFDPRTPADALFKKYKHINPVLSANLLFLTVIRFKNGTLLIPKMDHLAGDGYSYFYFLSALALLTQPGYIPFKKNILRFMLKPSAKRTVLNDFLFENDGDDLPSAEEDYRIAFERIPRKDVKSMIRECGASTGKPVSGNDILSAMAVKKTAEVSIREKNDSFSLTIPVDIRRQIKAYGPKYFGNGLYFNRTTFSTLDLDRLEIAPLAQKVRESMVDITEEQYRQYLASIEEIIRNGHSSLLRPFDPTTGCLVTNLSRLPYNRLNFGAGNPSFIFPLTIEKNSASILADVNDYVLRLVY